MWMNEHDIKEAADRHREHPVLGPATATLKNLMEWTNDNSDGWPYWQPPSKAAAKLQELIQGDRMSRFDDERADATKAKLTAALAPVKAFRTRRSAEFEIVETLPEAPRVSYTIESADEGSLLLPKATASDLDSALEAAWRLQRYTERDVVIYDQARKKVATVSVVFEE